MVTYVPLLQTQGQSGCVVTGWSMQILLWDCISLILLFHSHTHVCIGWQPGAPKENTQQKPPHAD